MRNYANSITAIVLSDDNFVKAMFVGGKRKNNDQLQKVIIRPVVIKGKKHIQFSYLDNKRDITKNYSGKVVTDKLHHVIKQKFTHITLQTTEKTIQIDIPAKGKVVISEHTNKEELSISFTHDQEKSTILSPTVVYPFLQELDIQTKDGKIRAEKYSKFRQINEFLKIISQTIKPSSLSKSLHIVDFGCGNGYLTFAVYFYFSELLHIPTTMTGVDIQEDLLTRLEEKAQRLGWEGLHFQHASIEEALFQDPVDIVIALHACDTATDDALSQAIAMGSQYIFSAPCCHHNLQERLHHAQTPQVFHPIVRQGILRERMGDILTDTFRSLLLQMCSYDTDVMEFVSPEHTSKNLLIRAVKTNSANIKRSIHEYNLLKKYWKVTPYLEEKIEKFITL